MNELLERKIWWEEYKDKEILEHELPWQTLATAILNQAILDFCFGVYTVSQGKRLKKEERKYYKTARDFLYGVDPINEHYLKTYCILAEVEVDYIKRLVNLRYNQFNNKKLRAEYNRYLKNINAVNILGIDC